MEYAYVYIASRVVLVLQQDTNPTSYISCLHDHERHAGVPTLPWPYVRYRTYLVVLSGREPCISGLQSYIEFFRMHKDIFDRSN